MFFSHGDGISFPQRTIDEVEGGLLDKRTNWDDESDDAGKVAFGKMYESDKVNFEVISTKPMGQLRT
ncbi:hypothetical protein CEXT_489071 [Caerostris extrusa]|uniref:Uncharacterized protein n=1 Tax=Caerostris extrusa TaxID=172846 RepID=A0AAV4YD65_CAEEX|nr:hypothetical protein CEXT_489071 [Caerostris extrusa]